MLVFVSVYSFFAAARILFQLRSVRQLPRGNASAIRQSLASLSNHCTNLQQLVASMFYLFGIALFIALQWVSVPVGNGKFSPLSVIVEFTVECAFASNVFVVLLVLQLLLWFASSQVNSSLEALSELS